MNNVLELEKKDAATAKAGGTAPKYPGVRFILSGFVA
jgi:hypothetical protein